MRERRKYVRLKIDSTIEYYNGKGERKQSAALQDISGGGLRFLTREDIERGRMFDIAFTLPETEDQIQATVEIVWSKPVKDAAGIYETGANFVKVESMDREKIGEYIYNHRSSMKKRLH
ncbi:MAG: PilZ domain-containing protein [bacterium]